MTLKTINLFMRMPDLKNPYSAFQPCNLVWHYGIGDCPCSDRSFFRELFLLRGVCPYITEREIII